MTQCVEIYCCRLSSAPHSAGQGVDSCGLAFVDIAASRDSTAQHMICRVGQMKICVLAAALAARRKHAISCQCMVAVSQ